MGSSPPGGVCRWLRLTNWSQGAKTKIRLIEITTRLSHCHGRAERVKCGTIDKTSKLEKEEKEFDVDDSDSDVSSSVDVSSDIDYDSDGYMTISAGDASVSGGAPEKPPVAVEAPRSSSELSSLDSNHDTSVPASRPSTTHESLPRVKIEIDSRTDRAPLDVNANKRKRASHSFADDENPRTKRPEAAIADDVDFIDLTQWANSD